MKAGRQKAKGVHSREPHAWWIAGADLECAHCSLGYAYEREVHCVECDAPMCALCVERVETRMLCPACVPRRRK